MNEITYFIYNGSITTVTGDYTAFENIVNNLGTTWEEYLAGKYIMLDEEQVNFLKEHDNASIKEIYDKTLYDEATKFEKQRFLESVENYGNSDEVNQFIVNGNKAWLKRDLRVGLKNKCQAEKEAGEETTIICLNDIAYTINIDTALEFLKSLELYAIKCFNNTWNLLSEAKAFTLRSEINSFDIKKGYPEILSFTF